MTKPIDYEKYLKSDQWKVVRQWALDRSGGKCQVCAGRTNLDVHHNTYENLGSERPEDLVALCRKCHKVFHSRLGKNSHGGASLYRPTAGEAPAEWKLLLLLVHHRDFLDRAKERLGPEEFSDPALRAVFGALVQDPELLHPPLGMDPSAAARLKELLENQEPLSEASRVFEEAVGQMKEAPLALEAEELRDMIHKEQDPVRQKELLEEYVEVNRRRREHKTDWRLATRRQREEA